MAAVETYNPAPIRTKLPPVPEPRFLHPPGPLPLAGPDPDRNTTDWNLNCHGDTRCCNCAAGMSPCYDPRTCGTSL